VIPMSSTVMSVKVISPPSELTIKSLLEERAIVPVLNVT
jgi:hypothetical protein